MAKPPTNEIGHGGTSLLPWSGFADETDHEPKLRWPANLIIYDKMRTDAQAQAVIAAVTLPIRRYPWFIKPNGAKDEHVDFVARNLNLPVEGEDDAPPGRRRDRFSFPDYLRHALLSLHFGHMFFEQVYRPEGEQLLLRKLASRMPRTIEEIGVAKDGGLDFIRQFPAGDRGSGLIVPASGFVGSPTIPVDRLVAHVQEREGGNWRGRSVHRSSYKHWLIKDRLLRVDAMKHERNGMGVPFAKALVQATADQMRDMNALAQKYRAGEAAGGALPYGFDLEFKGVQGSPPDTLASIRYHDEQIAKNSLAMFMQLGTTETGSRALGDTAR